MTKQNTAVNTENEERLKLLNKMIDDRVAAMRTGTVDTPIKFFEPNPVKYPKFDPKTASWYMGIDPVKFDPENIEMVKKVSLWGFNLGAEQPLNITHPLSASRISQKLYDPLTIEETLAAKPKSKITIPSWGWFLAGLCFGIAFRLITGL